MSSTPRNAKGNRQTVSSELTPREFHPNCRSDRAALIACNVVGADSAIVGLPQAARLLRSIAPPLPKKPFGFWGAPIRSDCDWTGVPLFSLWVMAKSEAIRYFQSVMNEITPFHRSLLLNRSWRTAAHAYAHHNHKEEVFGEWIFGCQGSLPFSPHKAKQVEGI